MTNISPSPPPSSPQPSGKKQGRKLDKVVDRVKGALPGLSKKPHPPSSFRKFDASSTLLREDTPSLQSTTGSDQTISRETEESTTSHTNRGNREKKPWLKGLFSKKSRQAPPPGATEELSSAHAAAEVNGNESEGEFILIEKSGEVQDSSPSDDRQLTTQEKINKYLHSVHTPERRLLFLRDLLKDDGFFLFIRRHPQGRSQIYSACFDNGAFLGSNRDIVFDILLYNGFHVLFPIEEEKGSPSPGIPGLPKEEYDTLLEHFRDPLNRVKALMLVLSSFGIPYKRTDNPLSGIHFEESLTKPVSLKAWMKPEDVRRNVSQLRHMLDILDQVGTMVELESDKTMIYSAALRIQKACQRKGISVPELDQFIKEKVRTLPEGRMKDVRDLP